MIADGHVMRFDYGGPDSAFLDEADPCGTQTPSNCMCSSTGATTVNIHAVLTTVLGAACGE